MYFQLNHKYVNTNLYNEKVFNVRSRYTMIIESLFLKKTN